MEQLQKQIIDLTEQLEQLSLSEYKEVSIAFKRMRGLL